MNIYPDNCVILAPLAGYTDLPYRSSAIRHGCTHAFTEMIDAGSLAYGHKKTFSMLQRGKSEKWLGVQIVGSDHGTLRKAVEIINHSDVDVLDFNLGCPARKVVKKGEGAALAKKTEEAIHALEVLLKYSKRPVTVKTRILDEIDPEPTINLVRRLVDAGAAAVTLHGRIMAKVYSGEVGFAVISEVRKSIDSQIIANGGVFRHADCEILRKETGCDCVMIARGAMGNPWIFEEIREGGLFVPPTSDELATEIELHLNDMVECYGEDMGMRISRKIIFDYLKGRGYSGELKNSVCNVKTMKELETYLAEIRRGPSPRYAKWLESNPDAPRRLTV
ncbi:MAG: tRNA-dihydrouridine synthase family protein [Victivallales bacterium]|jgi:nifR3 family TIM-barrel protein